MHNKWKCLKTMKAFTAGKIYTLTVRGYIVDDEGDIRFRPLAYNRFYGKEMFVEIVRPIQLENK